MVGAGGGRWYVSNVVGGRRFAFLLVGGRWLTVGGLWSVVGGWSVGVVLYYARLCKTHFLRSFSAGRNFPCGATFLARKFRIFI